MTIISAAITTTPTAAIATAISVPILSSVLDDLMDRVTGTMQKMLDSATSSVLSLEYEAGREVQLAIQNAKEAYAESLQLTMDKVDKTVTGKIDQLSNAVKIVQDNNQELLQKAIIEAQQVVLSLPFTSKQPQLTSIAPQCIVIDRNMDSVILKFKGVFPFSADSRYPTSLTLNDVPCPKLQNTTQELAYSAPLAAFPSAAANKCTYVMGNLKVLWDSGWVRSIKETADYKIGLGVLPLNPGKITAFYTLGDTHLVQKTYSSPTYRYDGNSWYKRDWINIPVHVPPEAGWRLDTSVAPRLVMESSHGNNNHVINGYDENGVQITVGLNCHDGKHMGIITFHVEFTEYQMQADKHSRSEDVALPWGSSKILETKTGESIAKIVFDCFDGSHNEFGPADTGNKYLKLVNENQTIRLVAQVPTDL